VYRYNWVRAFAHGAVVFSTLTVLGIGLAIYEWLNQPKGGPRLMSMISAMCKAYFDSWSAITMWWLILTGALSLIVALVSLLKSSHWQPLSNDIRSAIDNGDDDAVRGLTTDTGRSSQPRPYDLESNAHSDDDTTRWFKNPSNTKDVHTTMTSTDR